ncbi:MAG: hypothetical protein KGI38_07390 [Thaumarchaeota archaeon]|nr:hypothetical protein [Nitrososphaerota archaeon]
MPEILGALKTNAAYFFLAVGVVWIGVAFVAGSLLILWPVAACLASGVLLKIRPGRRLTWAWVSSSATLGLLISAYQVYAWAPFLGGAFSTIAGTTLGVFAVLTVLHVLLLYAGATRPRPAKSTLS